MAAEYGSGRLRFSPQGPIRATRLLPLERQTVREGGTQSHGALRAGRAAERTCASRARRVEAEPLMTDAVDTEVRRRARTQAPEPPRARRNGRRGAPGPGRRARQDGPQAPGQ